MKPETQQPGWIDPHHAGFASIKGWACRLKREAYALYFAYRDPRTPWYAKALAGLVVAHTFSPIDLIPDFIPILGFLDDLVITPVGIALAIRMIPNTVMLDARQKADQSLMDGKSVSRGCVPVIILLWLAVITFIGVAVWRLLAH
ncbi:MAG: YkvA family protein [Anaerolineaceae bacterium]|nr:YkvA family protein [Anaerolineaceae bacterium]